MISCLNSDFFCRQNLSVCEHRAIRRPSNGSGIYSKKHMGHRTVCRHINLLNLHSVYIRLFAYLHNHFINGTHNDFLKFPDPTVRILILMGNSGQDIQTVDLLGINPGSARQLFPAFPVDQCQNNCGCSDINSDTIPSIKFIFCEFRHVPFCKNFMPPLLLKRFHLHIPTDFCHTGQADSLFNFFWFQQISFRIRNFGTRSGKNADLTLPTDTGSITWVIYKNMLFAKNFQQIRPFPTRKRSSCLRNRNRCHIIPPPGRKGLPVYFSLRISFPGRRPVK